MKAICARCLYYRTRWLNYDSAAQPLCAFYTTTRVNPVTGHPQVHAPVLCETQNPVGDCDDFEQRPPAPGVWAWVRRALRGGRS